jgi:hypothetical protein
LPLFLVHPSKNLLLFSVALLLLLRVLCVHLLLCRLDNVVGIITLSTENLLRAVTLESTSRFFLKIRRFLYLVLLITVFSTLPLSLQAQESSTRSDTLVVRASGLRLSPEQIVFPSTAIGDSSEAFLTVYNDSLRSVLMTAVRGGGNSFHADPIMPQRIPAGETSVIRVVFRPLHFGRAGDSLSVVSEFGEQKIVLRGRSPFPLNVPDKEAVDFDSVARGTMVGRVININNPSINLLKIDSVWTHTPFFHSLVTEISVPGSDSAAINIAFSPVFSGAFSDTLFIESNARERIVEIPLTGFCPPPVLSILTEGIRFGQSSVTDSVMGLIRVTDASISSLNLSAVRTTGNGFGVPAGGIPPVILGKDTISIPVIFRPREFGEFSDSVLIESDGGSVRIPLWGKSPYPMLMASDDTVNFGEVRKGLSSRRSIIVRNPSINILRLDSIYTKSKWFTVRVKKTIVRSTDSLPVEVVFTPDRFRNYGDTIIIVGNSLNRRVEIPVSGMSPVPVLAVASCSLELEPISLGDTCYAEFVAYNRSHVNDLTIGGVQKRLPFFSIVSRLPAVLGRRDSVRLRVRFTVAEGTPNGLGIQNDTLVIDSDGGSARVAVSGISPFPSIASATDELDFGSVQKGERATVPLWITNSSLNTVRLDSIGMRHRRVFSVRGVDFPGIIRKGKAQSFTIVFVPDTDNVFIDTLRIYSSAPGPPMKIVLSGRCYSPHGTQATGAGIPTEFCLFENYPNPFRGSTTIKFGLPRPSTVSLAVFNTLGQLVTELANGYLEAGYHTVAFRSAGLSSGLYFYRFQAGDFVATRKLVVLR